METNQSKQTPRVPTAEQLTAIWTAFSEGYTSHIESSTLVGAKQFCGKFLSLRKQLKLPQSGLSLGEIACGSGQFMEHFLQRNPGMAARISMFDLTEAMVQKASQRLAKLSQTVDLSVRMESIVWSLDRKIKRQPNPRRPAAKCEVSHQRDAVNQKRRRPAWSP